jgi:hypothetical protein
LAKLVSIIALTLNPQLDLVRFDNAFDERYKPLEDKMKIQTNKAPDEVWKRVFLKKVSDFVPSVFSL